jgi:hypothetical protein
MQAAMIAADGGSTRTASPGHVGIFSVLETVEEMVEGEEEPGFITIGNSFSSAEAFGKVSRKGLKVPEHIYRSFRNVKSMSLQFDVTLLYVNLSLFALCLKAYIYEADLSVSFCVYMHPYIHKCLHKCLQII